MFFSISFLQGLRSASRPIFYVGDINSVQSNLIGPVASSIYRSSKRVSNNYYNILNFNIYLDNLLIKMIVWLF